MKTFEEFYKGIGFESYPFSSFSTENELERFSELFVPPDNYEPVKEAFENGNTMFIVGNRGIGKTALIEDFKEIQGRNSSLFCFVDDFSALKQDYSESELILFLLKEITKNLFLFLVRENKRIRKLDKEQRYLLAFMYFKFYPVVNKKALQSEINKIAMGKIKTWFSDKGKMIRFVLNFGLNIGTNIYRDTIARHFSFLPPLNVDEIKALIPELPESLNLSDFDAEISFSFLQRVVDMVKKMGLSKITIMLDKLDEDRRFTSNAEEVFKFYSPIMGNNKILLMSGFQLVFTVWQIAFDLLIETVRTQKHFCPRIEWNETSIQKVLNRRLETFSAGRIKMLNTIIAENISHEEYQRMLFYSNYNPRDLWHLMDSIMREQYRANSEASCIEASGFKNGLEVFVREFNYYEYYPKKIGSSNALDIQDFIRTLVRSAKIEFTMTELKDGSGKSGGSARNYIGEMAKMGLIKAIGRTGKNAFIYRIQDPKIVYMIENSVTF